MATSPTNPEQHEPARLKSLAQTNSKTALKYPKPQLQETSELVNSLNILTAPDFYAVLDVEPTADSNTIRKQYNKLSSLFHPDNNRRHVASCKEAFKLVNDAFGVLSDKALRESYDGKVDLEIREKMRTFWTACSTCRVLHQFERRYLGHKLVCPGCNKSFKAVEAVENDGSEEDEEDNTLGEFMLKNKKRKKNGKMGCEKGESFKGNGKMGCEKGESFMGDGEVSGEKGVSFKGDGEVGVVGRMGMRTRKRTRLVGEVLESSESKKVDVSEEETMTLADFQSKVKTKIKVEKEKMKGLEIGKGFEVKEKKDESSVKRNELRLEKHKDFSGEELQAMAVADSDFYDFDKDRVVRSFKKGQVWAVYDGDDDGMPRQYALIDETVSANPFQVRISWLDLQNNGDEKIVSREKLGFHVPCGRFKIANKTTISSVNVFSHVVDCDRAAREIYKIYPKKGSVWALYSEASLDGGEGKRCYDIVVFLTSYSEMNGMSMAFLEKVDGYKTVFKRHESGSYAVRFLGKDEFWLLSHQIPAQKLPCDEAPELLKDCWELDPASLPSDLLTIGGIDN
ncbi:uncharacterized protein LOC131651808 [Vicia villosa]|uniref:uncharacterized protein LOC131651808 n=1 Tax=Vicia villosa TaxID=3911 RepID=UPI00273AA580|nr:uncharacterized protein LOC131651808 [Vicia villosa]XP_058777494.1 uncharacterized protein LOC131651808 [Vicia villosa]